MLKIRFRYTISICIYNQYLYSADRRLHENERIPH